ncbi:MAG: phosphopantetheine-binding protein [Byssovorax sp.]
MARQGTTDLDPIRKIVEKHLQRRMKLTDETALVSGGLIDSMSLIDVILDLQEATGVTIQVSEVEPDDFDTVLKIAATLDRFRT